MLIPTYKSLIQDLPPQEIAKLAIKRNILHAPRWKRFQERLWYDSVLNVAAWCFRPEVFNFVLYMYTFDTIPDGIREATGLSDPYFIPTSVEDFLVRTSPLFSEEFQDQVRDRCRRCDGSFLGLRTKDGFVCTSNVLYAAVRITHEILSYYAFKLYGTMFAELRRLKVNAAYRPVPGRFDFILKYPVMAAQKMAPFVPKPVAKGYRKCKGARNRAWLIVSGTAGSHF